MLEDPSRIIREEVYAEDHWHDFEDQARAVRTKQFKYIRNYYPDLPNTPSADIIRGELFQSILKLKNEAALTNVKTKSMFESRADEELYDIIEDPYEMNNLAMDSAYFGVLESMRQTLAEWQIETDDVVPVERTPDEFTRDTGEPLPVRKRPRPSKKDMTYQPRINK